MFDQHSIAFLVYLWYAVEDVLTVFGFDIHYDLSPPYDVRCQPSLAMVEATPILERLNIYKIVAPTFLGIASEYQVLRLPKLFHVSLPWDSLCMCEYACECRGIHLCTLRVGFTWLFYTHEMLKSYV